MNNMETVYVEQIERLKKDLEVTEHSLSSLIKKYEILKEENSRLVSVLKRHNIKFE